MTGPALDVMAVLADLQQQLSDLTRVVEAQQRTLQSLAAATTGDVRAGVGPTATPPIGGTGRA